MERDNLEKDIQELVAFYLKNNKQLFGKDFYKKIVTLYIINKDIGQYVSDEITISQEINDYVAAFIPNEKKIYMYTQGINKRLKYIQENLKFTFNNNEETILFLSLAITQYLLHELEHVFQQKEIQDKEDKSAESRLLKASEMDLDFVIDNYILGEKPIDNLRQYVDEKVILLNKLYYKNYNKALRERLAQIRSIKTLEAVTRKLNLQNNINIILKHNLIKEKLRGYEKDKEISSPSLDYIHILGEEGLLNPNNCDFYSKDRKTALEIAKSKLNFNERLELGLPISKDEYNQVEESASKILVKC